MVDRYIRDGPLKRYPLHKMQCAYQPGKSTETALHYVVSQAEKALENKEVCLGAFLDVEGAFDRTTFNSICGAAMEHGIPNTLCRWMENMLKGRIITSDHMGEKLSAITTKGCPQGGVLSPTLWSLVIDSLIASLNRGPIIAVGYADDIVILVNGKVPDTVKGIMNKALREVQEWCNANHLNINPSKTIIVPFTRLRKLKGLENLKMNGTELQLSKEVKYLGVTLDKEC